MKNKVKLNIRNLLKIERFTEKYVRHWIDEHIYIIYIKTLDNDNVIDIYIDRTLVIKLSYIKMPVIGFIKFSEFRYEVPNIVIQKINEWSYNLINKHKQEKLEEKTKTEQSFRDLYPEPEENHK